MHDKIDQKFFKSSVSLFSHINSLLSLSLAILEQVLSDFGGSCLSVLVQFLVIWCKIFFSISSKFFRYFGASSLAFLAVLEQVLWQLRS